MTKKQYVAPFAELMLLIPAEAVATNGAWSWKWQWGQSTLADNASVTGIKQLWIDAVSQSSESRDPY